MRSLSEDNPHATGCLPTAECMKDYPPINERIKQASLIGSGATGILYYRSDGWSSGNAIGSWNNVNFSVRSGNVRSRRWGVCLCSRSDCLDRTCTRHTAQSFPGGHPGL